LEKRTNGRVKVQVYPGGTLMPANQTWDGVIKGITDIGMSVVAYTPGRQPLSEGLTLPMGYKTSFQAVRVYNAWYAKFKPKEYDSVKLFYLHSTGPGIFHTKKPVNKLQDLKGLRIKADAVTSKIVSAAGATPSTIPVIETYDALKRGIVEGAFVPVEGLKAFKFSEILPYTYTNHAAAFANPWFVAMNKEKWNSLPPDIQQIIEKLNLEWVDKTGRQWDQSDREAEAELIKSGHKFVTASPEDEAKMVVAMKLYRDKYIKEMKEKNLPGEEVLKWIQDYLKTAPEK
jgi:TRAP-type C4-dicarboxylate transport system substrate-binding protein